MNSTLEAVLFHLLPMSKLLRLETSLHHNISILLIVMPTIVSATFPFAVELLYADFFFFALRKSRPSTSVLMRISMSSTSIRFTTTGSLNPFFSFEYYSMCLDGDRSYKRKLNHDFANSSRLNNERETLL